MTQHESVFNDVETREVNKVAALDIGSNSFHLVVARIVAGSVQILHRVKQKVRLAEGLNDDDILSDEAMERGLAMLKVVAESLKGFEPDSVRIVATHTLRKARNARDFISAAKSILPYPIEVISGVEEARLIYSGVAHTNHADGQQLVIDIGGGSTEFVIGEGFTPLLCRSLQMGCVSYTKRFFPNGELKAKAFDRAITAAQQELELIDNKYRKLGWVQCIGTSGTIRSLFTLCQQDRSNGHDIPVTLKSLRNLMKQFVSAGHVDKLSFPDLSEDRRVVIAGGLAILIAVFKALEIEGLVYSPAALREGVLYQMEDELHHADIRGRTASSLATRYDVDTTQATMVLNTTLLLFNEVEKAWKLTGRDFKNMLGWAALLHEVGMQINSRGIQKHSAYILGNVDMPGFTQEQQLLLATLVRFHRKKIRTSELPTFNLFDEQSVKHLIALLRLGVLLNIKRQEGFVPDLIVQVEKSELTITLPDGWLDEKPIISADLLRESHYWKALDLKLTIVPDITQLHPTVE
ncbi:exopolyphosphatase [Alteromonas sp. KUL106]|uniref:exopolyphosphatase n=1 Tax=Alteromonas sp. KUL106 TaxID=2480799 RepID=UPI0012E5532D|nr:exopolyphosphatase [Alteromonas sp. KUL106]GFD67364.1 exopolyphosphatase [Alteromonas sp. KUL106]GFD78063.1 exopolyphosphatase [Tenacibaculum sp. KUL118]